MKDGERVKRKTANKINKEKEDGINKLKNFTITG